MIQPLAVGNYKTYRIINILRLDRKVAGAPADTMNLVEACAMGNLARVQQLVNNGVVSTVYYTYTPVP